MTITMQLANNLEKQYPDLNFRNHCYLRIAYDNVVGNKWDNIIERPFTKKASLFQVGLANDYLEMYKKNKYLLLEHNKISLTYRKK